MFGMDTTIASVIVRKDGPEEENSTSYGVRIPLFRKSSNYTWSGASNLGSEFHNISAKPFLFLEPVSELSSEGTIVINWTITVLRNKFKKFLVGRKVLTVDDSLPTQYELTDEISDQLKCGDVIVITASRDGSDPEDTIAEDFKGLGLFIASN